MDSDLKKLLENMDAQSSMGQQESPDVQSEESVYNPKYIEAIQARQAAAAPIGAQGMQQASDISKIGSMATAAGAVPSPATPYLMGAGLGLQALGMVSQAKQQEKRAKYEAEVAKATARQRAIDNLAALSSRLRV
jgi:hypothetical protein